MGNVCVESRDKKGSEKGGWPERTSRRRRARAADMRYAVTCPPFRLGLLACPPSPSTPSWAHPRPRAELGRLALEVAEVLDLLILFGGLVA